MSTSKVRAFLAMAVVGVFMLITGFMAIFPLVSPADVNLNDYADFFAKTASVYTGIIGVIIGYYFGRSEEKQVDRSNASQEKKGGDSQANPRSPADG